MKGITRREMFQKGAAISTVGLLACSQRGREASESAAAVQPEATSKLAQVGWCWDGQGFCLGIPPSIFGQGEGTKWFGLTKTCYMFHPNTELALEKLREFDEVICEISKWKWKRCESEQHDCGAANHLDGRVETKKEEASKVSRLAQSFPNIKGAIDDDLLGIIKREGIKPEEYATVYEALKEGNPDLKLWTVVYTRELNQEDWAGFEPFMDIINLCVGKERTDFPNLDRYLDQCAEIFPGKPVNLIYRLTDFRPPEPIPMDLLKSHWEDILRFVKEGRLSGYSILGGFMIDLYPEESRWLRGFIAAN